MSGTLQTTHERFDSLLADHLLDLLDAAQSAQVETHARECAECGRRLALARAARPDWWTGTGHPPVPALVAWSERRESLPEFERTLLARHLEHCDECREDAEALAGAPEREVGHDDARTPAYVPWTFAASLAAVLLLLVYVRPQRAPEPVAAVQPEVRQPSAPAPDPAPSGAAAATVPAPAAHAAAPHASEPIALASATRGEAAAPARVELVPGLRTVAFTLPALFVPEGAKLVIELRDAAGATLLREELPAARALLPGGVRLPAERLASGARVLRVAWLDDTTGSEAREYPLDVIRH